MESSSVKKSPIPGEIIKALQKEKTLRFKELKDKLRISGPTLSIHLKMLISEGIIEFEKKCREKHYRLSKKAIKDSCGKIEIFSSNHINQIERLVRFGVYDMKEYDENEERTPREHYENLVNAIGTYFLFTLFKGFETGENWFEGFNKKELGVYILDSFCHRVFENFDSSDLLIYLMNEDFDRFYKEASSRLNKKGKKTLKTVFENIEHMYGYHFNALKNSLKENYKYTVHL